MRLFYKMTQVASEVQKLQKKIMAIKQLQKKEAVFRPLFSLLKDRGSTDISES